MTRTDLVSILEIAFPDYNVVESPLHAVVPPAVIVGGSTREIAPYGGGWGGQWEIVFVAGPMDDTDLYLTCDDMQNLACDKLNQLPARVDLGQRDPPAPRTIGGVDYLTFLFTFTDLNIHGSCT